MRIIASDNTAYMAAHSTRIRYLV